MGEGREGKEWHAERIEWRERSGVGEGRERKGVACGEDRVERAS